MTVTTEADARLPPATAFERIVPVDLSKIFARLGRFRPWWTSATSPVAGTTWARRARSCSPTAPLWERYQRRGLALAISQAEQG